MLLKAFVDPDHAYHATAQQLMEECGTHCAQAIFRAAFPTDQMTFEALTEAIKWARKMPADLVDQTIDDLLFRGLETVLAQTTPGQVFQNRAHELRKGLNEEQSFVVVKAFIKASTSIADFMIAKLVITRSWALLAATESVVGKNLEHFVSLKPTVIEWIRLFRSLRTYMAYEAVANAALANLRDLDEIAEFLSAIKPPFWAPPFHFRLVDRLIKDEWPRILALQPTTRQLDRLLNLVDDRKVRAVLLSEVDRKRGQNLFLKRPRVSKILPKTLRVGYDCMRALIPVRRQ